MRNLAHSYRDELPPLRQAEPYRESWRDHARDVLTIIGQATFLLAMFAVIIYALPIMFLAAER